MKERKYSAERCGNMSKAHTGVKLTSSHRSAISNGKKGLAPHAAHEAIRKNGQPPSSPSQLQVVCPHCSKTGTKLIMARWHFDHCRWHPNISDVAMPEAAREAPYTGAEIHPSPFGRKI